MRLQVLWNRMMTRLSPRAALCSGRELAEELMSHFRALVADKVKAGMSLDAAWTCAEEQFGSVLRYEDECRLQQFSSRLVHERIIAGLLLLMAAAVGLTAVLRPSYAGPPAARLSAATALAFAKSADAADGDFHGTIQDAAGKPLADATVLVILKTWPNGQYHQDDYATTTDQDGHFEWKGLVPEKARYAIHCAAFKEGYVLRTNYQIAEKAPFKKPGALTLKMQQASALTVSVQTPSGQPVAGTLVAPRSRKQGKEEETLYFQGSEPTWKTTDAEGHAVLTCFKAGDSATIAYRGADDTEWTEREIRITKDGGRLDIVLDAEPGSARP